MPERPLNPKRGPQLYQSEALLEGTLTGPPPEPGRPLARRPRCPVCKELELPSKLVAAPNQRWACGRGHGVL